MTDERLREAGHTLTCQVLRQTACYCQPRVTPETPSLDVLARKVAETWNGWAQEIDVERLAIAMSYVEMRTMVSPTEPGPQTLRDAERIAAEYARLSQPTQEPS